MKFVALFFLVGFIIYGMMFVVPKETRLAFAKTAAKIVAIVAVGAVVVVSAMQFFNNVQLHIFS